MLTYEKREGASIKAKKILRQESLSVHDVLDVVDCIQIIQSDYEVAHALEDDLHRAVLKIIADSSDSNAWLAKAALTTVDLDFARYCA